MQPERTFYVGSHPCQAYRKTSYNGWAWGLLSMGSLKFRQLESDGANGENRLGILMRDPLLDECVRLGQLLQRQVRRDLVAAVRGPVTTPTHRQTGGRQLEPEIGVHEVLRHALATGVHHPEVILRLGDPLRRRPLI